MNGKEGRKTGDQGDRDMESVGLKEEDALERTRWKNHIHYHCGDSRWEKPQEEDNDEDNGSTFVQVYYKQ